MTTTEREMLMLCAKACGYWCNEFNCVDKLPHLGWNPLHDDGDCARICAELTLKTEYLFFVVVVANESKILTRTEQYKNHNNRLAAWRYACCRVAAEIGRWTT